MYGSPMNVYERWVVLPNASVVEVSSPAASYPYDVTELSGEVTDARFTPPGFVDDAAYEYWVTRVCALGYRSRTVEVICRPIQSYVDCVCAPVGSVVDNFSPSSSYV